jgi:uncharacterized protein YdiU (UPF0061 family)
MKTRFSNSYLSLPEQFYQRVSPTPVEAPTFVALNEPLAEELGLESSSLRSPEWLAVLAGNRVPEGAQPVALAYSGHQFGHFVPLLGDGRAVLIGELTTPQGLLYDLQLKGSGRTPYSRRGDGRAALGPMLREYIIGEALHHLGIPATRTLAVVASGEVVVRERPLPGGIQSRIAQSHVRIGTFQYASERGDRSALAALADYVIARHYPELVGGEDRYFELARSFFSRQARLVAQWMHVGFIHGVMNTDNVAVSGESIDFGPCAFMNRYDPDTVFSSIDRDGRYAFGMQPTIIQWNLTRLVEALVPLFGTDENTAVARAQELVDGFPALFTEAWYDGMRAKLGLCGDDDGDNELIKQLLEGMYAARVDYTNTFRALSGDAHFSVPAALNDWRVLWDSRIDPTRNGRSREESLRAMRCVNPAVIARNHLVENALKEAVDNQNLSIIHQLVNALRDPYTPQSDYGSPPSDDHDQGYRTFCGT